MNKYARNSGLGLPEGPPPLSFAESDAQAAEYFEEYGRGFEERLREMLPLWGSAGRGIAGVGASLGSRWLPEP